MKKLSVITMLSALACSPMLLAAQSARVVGGSAGVEPGAPLAVSIAVTNATENAVAAKLTYSIWRNPQNLMPRLPDPVHGADHATGCLSWIEVNGEKIDDGSLTDGDLNTGRNEGRKYTEAFHFVDLGQVRQVTALAWQSGDANWIYRVDIAASTDGTTYEPVAGLQGLDWHKKWARQRVKVEQPFAARFLRLRYHNNGAELGWLRTPSELHVYDGPTPDEFAFPTNLGAPLENGTLPVELTAETEKILTVGNGLQLETGAYLLCARLESGTRQQLLAEGIYIFPPDIAELPADSPFGINGSGFDLFEQNRRLGIKWMRFENMKWQMSMPGPDRYAFDGSVAPWNVKHDEYMQRYTDLGVRVLPYTFQTPKWLSRAPEGTSRNVHGYPPHDFSTYGDMMFQLVARYGSVRHPPEALKSDDKLSGLGLIDTYQLWNEPNLVGPTWAPWVGSMDEFMEIFRIGSEAVKRADPAARVSPAGFAGIAVTTVDNLYRYQYADGKRPLDFADLISVHFYSGQRDPEVTVHDRNAIRTGDAGAGAPTYPEALLQLLDWRDDHAPGKPVWLTETGNDVGGPMGLGEWEQAAKIPRVTMLALSAGIEKVFIYREKGSNPSQHAGAGLVRNDNSFRPSWFTYATLIRQFQGVAPGRAWRVPHDDPAVWIYVWQRNGAPLVTAWTIGETDVRLGLDLGQCEVVDAFGHATSQSAADLRLGYYPQYIGNIARPEVLEPLVAQARAAEAARQAKRRADAERRTLLFDFGSRDVLGTLMLGTLRRYTGVLAEDVYDANRGWGFHPRAGAHDNSAGWISDPVRKDCVRIYTDLQFRFQLEPGRYRLQVLAQPLGNEGQLTIGPAAAPQTLALRKGSDPAAISITLTEKTEIVMTAGCYADLHAIAVIEE